MRLLEFWGRRVRDWVEVTSSLTKLWVCITFMCPLGNCVLVLSHWSLDWGLVKCKGCGVDSLGEGCTCFVQPRSSYVDKLFSSTVWVMVRIFGEFWNREVSWSWR